uniref:AB hydrolase-1 domain-containing protein n=1 Tax=Entomoneis paludosa TaxID=265537 RepID=A0A7S2Y5Z5_9STRA
MARSGLIFSMRCVFLAILFHFGYGFICRKTLAFVPLQTSAYQSSRVVETRCTSLFMTIEPKTTEDASAIPPSRPHDVEFISPLLKYGYKPAVDAWESGEDVKKPILLYLPGFDGTFLSPFLQFPELHTIFDVRCMTISTKDRSTYEELKVGVVQYLESISVPSAQNVTSDNAENEKTEDSGRGGWIGRLFGKEKVKRRPVYLAGESFGGILASDVALTILKGNTNIDLQGLCLINAATCYDRSRLAAEAPRVAEYPSWLYTAGLLRLLPLFTDEYSASQLLRILKAEGLPSVIDDETREAYMGRVAFSLPFVIPYIDQGVLQWRLTEWLSYGCNYMLSRLSEFKQFKDFRTLIVAGEKDATLPSIDECERIASLLPRRSTLHIVEGAGHASTCGARVDLAGKRTSQSI